MLKRILWFSIGVLLSFVTLTAFAVEEQTNAVASSYSVNGRTGTSGQEACTALGTYSFSSGTTQPATSGGFILYQSIVAGTCDYQGVAKATVYVSYTCPPGATKDSSNRCMYPAQCNPGEIRQPDGSCKADTPCPTYPPSTPDSLPLTQPSNCQCPAGTQWYAGNGCRKTCDPSQPTGGVANAGFGIAIADGASEACFQGCLVQHQAGAYDQYKGYKVATATWSKWACKGTGLGSAPTPDGNPEPDAQTQDPSKKKDPPCAAGEGVITSSSGGVKCLPEGTPNTSKPSVEKKQKIETFPDNTTKTTTETTTRDPNTNATSVSVTTTSTGGQSGPAGTSTSQEGTTGKVGGGNGDGDGDGSCDPTLNFCGGPGTDGMYTKKEKSMSSVFTQFQNTVKNSPVGSASTGFFTVATPSGSCPAWSVQVPMLNITLNAADYFCNGGILAALQGAGYVMLALATYIAFTWAFL